MSLQLRTFASNLQGDDLLQLDSPLDSGPEDQAGFHAACRTRILKVAKDRRMLSSEAKDR
ncbi:MAG: hypothetical protein E6L08_13865 [Verrucomicrobia bacterium]|nr:MAG: hypothetical protein E6L08_13865 [Verrucomicrobiota bacterium]